MGEWLGYPLCSKKLKWWKVKDTALIKWAREWFKKPWGKHHMFSEKWLVEMPAYPRLFHGHSFTSEAESRPPISVVVLLVALLYSSFIHPFIASLQCCIEIIVSLMQQIITGYILCAILLSGSMQIGFLELRVNSYIGKGELDILLQSQVKLPGASWLITLI